MLLSKVGVSLCVAAFGLVMAACSGGDDSTVATATTPAGSAGSASPAASPSTTAVATQPAASASATVALKDPCSYVTVAEVQSTTGKTVAAAGGRKVNDFLCSYATTDGGVVNAIVATPVQRANWEQTLKANAPATAPPTAVSGLGDAAFNIFQGVSVLKGTTAITVEVSPNTEQAGGAAAINLAKLILTRI